MAGTMVALAFGATLLATASWALLSNGGAVAACAALLFALRALERRAPADPVKQI
jgi:hypothetical protein